MRAAEAWAVVERLLASPGFGILTATGRHAAVAAEVLREVHQGNRGDESPVAKVQVSTSTAFTRSRRARRSGSETGA